MIAACRALLLFGVLLAASTACGSDAPDEAEVLVSITDDVIVPNYEALASGDGIAQRCASRSLRRAVGRRAGYCAGGVARRARGVVARGSVGARPCAGQALGGSHRVGDSPT